MRHLRFICIVALLFTEPTCVVAESGETVREPETTSGAAASRDEPPPTPVERKTADAPCELYVAGPQGVQCASEGGELWRTLFGTPVEDAFFYGNEIIAWSTQPTKMYRLSAVTGKALGEVSLRPALPQGCDASDVWPSSRIIVPLPRKDPTSGQLCFEVSNGPFDELEEVRLSGLLTLSDFSLTLVMVWNFTECPFESLPEGHLCARPDPRTSLVALTSQHRYFLEDGQLLESAENGGITRVWGPFEQREPKSRTREGLDVLTTGLGSFVPIGATPAGRFVVLEGNATKGDVKHVEMMLFDREQGEFYPLPKTPTADWPAPLEVDQLRELEPGLVDMLTVIHGERPRFVGNGEEFAIGKMLFDPLRGAVRIPGRLVVQQ